MPVLSSIIPKDLELLDKDTESLKQLFTELEKHADKVEELVEMDTGTSDTFLVEQVLYHVIRSRDQLSSTTNTAALIIKFQ